MSENTETTNTSVNGEITVKPGETNEKKKGLTTQHVVLILGLAIVIAAVVIIILVLRSTEETPSSDVRPIITEENYLEIEAQIRERVERGMFETHMNTTWRFRDGASPSHNAVMGNSGNNNFPFYFTITLRDTGEVVFTSGLLPLGTQIAEIKLEKELTEGTYAAVVNVNMIDDDGQPVDANMGINVDLIIES